MQEKIFNVIFIFILYFFMLFAIFTKDHKISYTERRYLTEFPEIKFDKDYPNRLEDYLLDQFPSRDTLRNIKAEFNLKILRKEENNDYVLYQNGMYKSDYPTSIKDINNYLDYVTTTKSFLSPENHVYLMVVPDKNYYLTKKYFLKIDYDYLYNTLNKLNLPQIDVRNILNLNDYYLTDTHWRQEKLSKVVDTMLQKLNIPKANLTYNENIYKNFKGVYSGNTGFSTKSENLIYLTNKMLANAQVKYLENQSLNTIYNLANLNSFDSYEVFLDGASAYIEITNNDALTSKELVVFRDSFGSSIIPLLIPYYSKITVIDNRYIKSTIYRDLIDFTNQDVIFLNSTLLVNTSSTLKK